MTVAFVLTTPVNTPPKSCRLFKIHTTKKWHWATCGVFHWTRKPVVATGSNLLYPGNHAAALYPGSYRKTYCELFHLLASHVSGVVVTLMARISNVEKVQCGFAECGNYSRTLESYRLTDFLCLFHQNLMEKFAECVQDSEQLKSALLEMKVYCTESGPWVVESHVFNYNPFFLL